MSITLDGSNYVWSFYRDNSNKNLFYFDLDNSGTYVLVAYGNLDSSGSKILIHTLNIEKYCLFFFIALLKHTFRDITSNAVVIDPVATPGVKITNITNTTISSTSTTRNTITSTTRTTTTTKTATTTPSPAKDKSKLKAHGN